MKESERLVLILKFLNNEWRTVKTLLSDDQLEFLKSELEGLEKQLEGCMGDSDKTDSIAINFNPVFSEMKPIAFLSEFGEVKERSSATAELEEDITIVLLNSLKKIKEQYSKDTGNS